MNQFEFTILLRMPLSLSSKDSIIEHYLLQESNSVQLSSFDLNISEHQSLSKFGT